MMTTSLARYHARAPRYVLDTDDNNLIRLSGAEQWAWEESTELRDVSLTGLSFTAPQDLSPQIGEVIKVQFTVPNAQQMACYAIVIRIEKIDELFNLVGVHFYKLDRTQRLNIVQGLSSKIKAPAKVGSGSKLTRSPLQLVGLVLAVLTWLAIMQFFFFR